MIKHTIEDFDAICGAMAAQLAALFEFLRPGEEKTHKADQNELALYADPTYWLYCMAHCPFAPRAVRRRQQKQEEHQISEQAKKGRNKTTQLLR